MAEHTPKLTASGDRIYGERPEDGIVARVYDDPALAEKMAAERDELMSLNRNFSDTLRFITETLDIVATERDHLREVNAELLEAAKDCEKMMAIAAQATIGDRVPSGWDVACFSGALQTIRTAIAKATGEGP